MHFTIVVICSSEGQVAGLKASASREVDSGLIPNRVKPMAIKLVFTAFQLNALP